MYVAETDADGDIVCVWVALPRSRTACVFDPQKHIFDPSEPADFSGKRSSQIVSWMASRRMVATKQAQKTRAQHP